MSNDTETLIQEIATRHGVLIGKDDPILILQTMNQKLLEEHARSQDALLGQFKSCLEEMLARQKHESRDKSERMLNASLLAAKESAQLLLQETTESVRSAMNKELDTALKAVQTGFRNNQKFIWLQLLTSAITGFGVLVFAALLYFH